MRNFVTVIALMVSTAGIFVSLAREELRCRLGLSAETCQSSVEKSKESLKDASLMNQRFTKPSSERSIDHSRSREKGSLEAPSDKSNSQNLPNQNRDQTSEIPQEVNGTKILKSDGESSSKPPTSAEPVKSGQDNPSASATTTEPAYPPHEGNQMATDDSAASANNSKPDNTSVNQPIPVIPPPQPSQP